MRMLIHCFIKSDLSRVDRSVAHAVTPAAPPNSSFCSWHHRGATLLPSPVSVQLVKSIMAPHLPHLWGRSNSSEKISFSAPHFWQLQVNDFRLLKLA
jgi:hypothetical protein